MLYSVLFSLPSCTFPLSLSPHPLPHRLDDLRTEYDDFQESSRELEAELEAQLEQAEGVNKDLLSRVQRLENENESMRVRLCVGL